MRIHILTSCTGEKIAKPKNQLTQSDFANPNVFSYREGELADYIEEAQCMYTGQQHVRLMRYIEDLQGQLEVELSIVSAGYGLISGSQRIAPYECTFQGMGHGKVKEWAEFLNIPNSARRWFLESADIKLVLLGESYLRALSMDENMHFASPTLFFSSTASSKLIPNHPLISVIPLSNLEAKRFHCGLVGLKGELGGRALVALKTNSEVLPQLLKGGSASLDVLDFKKQVVSKAKSIPKPHVEKQIEPSLVWQNANHRKNHMFYVPDWDDMVDPDFDFTSDTHSGNSGTWNNQVYSHQLLHDLPCDGILVSKATVDGRKAKRVKITEIGIHAYLRLPKTVSVMGDCGAFSYLLQDEPTCSVNEVISYYTECGFDRGISLDHLMLGATDVAGQRARYDLTVHNAEVFLNEHKKQGLVWEAVGALQGMSVNDYVTASQNYVKMGYKSLAIGGQVRGKTDYICQIVKAIREVVPNHVKLHVLGVSRLEAIPKFIRLGVNSSDSASYLRQAWIRDGQNYIAKNGDLYTAIRIPQSVNFISNLGDDDTKQVLQLEHDAMQGLRNYEQGKADVDTCLAHIVAYTNAINKPISAKTLAEYQITLADRAWSECNCAICKKIGIEVVIFRGGNRNRRRGFHNNYIAYQEIKRLAVGDAPLLFWKKAGSPRTLEMEFNYE